MILGIGHYISFIIIQTRDTLTIRPEPEWPLPVKTYLVIYCALAFFLFLEALLRMGSLILYLSRHHVLLHHRALTSEDSLKPYQIMFGRSTSITFLKWVSL